MALELLLHSTPRRGGSLFERMRSMLGLEWISSRPCRNPSEAESETGSSAGGSLGVCVAGDVSSFFVTMAGASLLSSCSLFVAEEDLRFFSFLLSHSLSEGGFVLVGVDSLSLAEPPLNPSSSPAAPRGFWCIR